MANASIFQQYLQPPRSVQDYASDMDKADANRLGLLHQQGVNALQALTNQQTQQSIADDQAVRQATIASNGDQNALLRALNAGGQYKASQALQKTQLDNLKTKSDIGLADAHAGKFTQETEAGKADAAYKAAAHHADGLAYVQTPDDIRTYIDQGIAKGIFPAERRDQMMAKAFSYPSVEAWRAESEKAAVPVVERFKIAAENARNAATNATSLANNTATNATHVQTNAATNATSRANNSATIAGENSRSVQGRANQLLLAGMNPDGTQRAPGPVDAAGQLDIAKVAPADLAAAYRYKTDGTLPPNMGRGVQGAAEGLRIRAIASALDTQTGQSPEDARVRQLALKGDVGAINLIRKREVQVGANVKNFDFNADQVLQLSDKVDRSGVPIVNAWMNAGRRAVTGNPELSAFDVAVKTTVNEFAQIVSGTTSGATAEGEKKKAEALLNAAQTPAQITAIVNQMKVESRNRMQSFAAQRAESMPTNVQRAPVNATTGGAGGMPTVSAIDAEIARRRAGAK